MRNLLRYLIAAVVLVGASLWIFAPLAWADGVDSTDTVAELRISALGVSLVVSLVIPLVVGLVTKCSTTIKGLISVVLNAVQTLIVANVQTDGQAIISWPTLCTWLIATAISVATYANVYKPLGLTSSLVERVRADRTVEMVPGKLADVGVK